MSGVIEHNSTEHQQVIVSGFKSFTSGLRDDNIKQGSKTLDL